MCRNSRFIRFITAMVALCAFTLPMVAHGDDANEAVAAYLEQHQLYEPLSTHLESMLESSSGDQRRDLVMRLAQLYAQMLDAIDDPSQRERIELRSQRLLTLTDAEGAEELRLSLLRAQYRPAERIAEQHRLRLAERGSLDRAKAILEDITPQLERLNQDLARNVSQLEQQRSRARGSGSRVLADRIERARRLHTQSSFITAWALYHHGWLQGDNRAITAAESLFAELLLSDSARPQPQDISVDLRASEPFARAILGMALCRSQSVASSSIALAWVDLLTHENTYAPLRDNVAVWRMVIQLEHGVYRAVFNWLRESEQEHDTLPLMWLRLAAAHALESPRDNRDAQELAQYAVTTIAARNEYSHVLDLAERYGMDVLGDDGFALRYIRGLILYREARELHDHDQPTSDTQINARYRDAIDELQQALDEPDAMDHSDAIGSCQLLHAWAHYYLGNDQQAIDSFLLAEQRLIRNKSEALWMAIVALDRLISINPSAERKQLLQDLQVRFLDDYPTSTHAPTLLLRHTLTMESLDDDALRQLLQISEDHPMYVAAQYRIAQAFYQRFREEERTQRTAHGDQFLTIAAKRLDDEASSNIEAARLVLLLRQILEISLADGIARSAIAARALDRFEDLASNQYVDVTHYAQELAYRRIQLLLIDHDLAAADSIAESLWSDDPVSSWSRLAARYIFHYANRRATSADERTLRIEARQGGRVLREFADDPSALRSPQVLALHAAVADTLRRLWEHYGDKRDGQAALFLYQRLLDVQPRDGSFLHHAASLARAFDEYEFSVRSWRTIAAGSTRGSDRWFEARYELMATLAAFDIQRAQRVLQQHLQLYPDYGPEPWGAQIYELESTMLTETSP
jgi:hypothetical protein